MPDEIEDNTKIKTGAFSALNPYFLLGFSASCILSSLFLQQIFAIIGQGRIGIAVAPLVAIVLPVFLLMRRFLGFRKELRIRKPNMRIGLYVVLAAFASVVVVDGLFLLSQQFLPVPSDYIEGLRHLKPHGFLPLTTTFIGLCVVVPLAEEVIFRGLIQRVFARNMGGVVAFVLSGVFFGAIHLSPHLLLSMVAFGIFLGFLLYATENLTYTIVAHAILNTVALWQLTVASDDDLSLAPFYLQRVGYLALAIALLVFLLWQIKKGASALEAPSNRRDDSETNQIT